MILTFGNTQVLRGMKWHILELRSERTVENVIRRIGKAMPSIFKDSGSCEVFVPIEDRDLNLFSLQTSSYVFLRSDRRKELHKFKGVTGVVGILCEGEQQRLDKAILLDDEYVQGVIQETEKKFRQRPNTLGVGSFVRVLDGLDKGFCGHVASVDRDYALVRVELKTRQMFIETPLQNLKDLSEVPVHSRVFYYSELIDEFVREYDERAVISLSADLSYTPEISVHTKLDEVEVEEKKVKFGRQNTVTAMTKNLIYNGERDPRVLIAENLKAIEAGRIKKPKSAFIFYSILKQAIMETLFRDDPEVGTYKDVIKIHGEAYRFSPKIIQEIDKKGTLPAKSETNPRTSTVIKIKLT